MFSISCSVYVYIVLTLKLIVKQYDSYTLVSCLIGSSDNKKNFSQKPSCFTTQSPISGSVNRLLSVPAIKTQTEFCHRPLRLSEFGGCHCFARAAR